MIRRVSELCRWLGQLSGWRRHFAAFLFGICGTLTLAPLFLFPLLLPAFSGLFALLQLAPSRKAMFWDGWWWGWGFFMSGLYWFCVALLTDADRFAWLIPFALFGLTGVIALYSALACVLMSYIPVRGLSRLLMFAVVWVSVEYARALCLSGFPWNLIGYSFGFSTASLQLASVVGIYGLTFLAVVVGLTPMMTLAGKRGRQSAGCVWAVVAAALIWGAWRLGSTEQRFVPDIQFRLVQANIAQPHKWDPERQLEGMKEHVRLMLSGESREITHFIWPETAVPYVLQSDSPLSRLLGEALPKGAVLLTGALRSEGEESDWLIWNTLAAIDDGGHVIGTYDKQRLVPFGEFQPLRPYVPKEWMTPVGEHDFARGTEDELYSWAGLPPMRPLICYEAIFAELPRSSGARPAWMLNVTNDAWFGISSGPHQHFHMARMRAVEQGVPLVRAANTGISAVTDGLGRIIGHLPLGTQGVLDAQLPQPTESDTFFSSFGALLMPVLWGLGAMLWWRQRPKPSQS